APVHVTAIREEPAVGIEPTTARLQIGCSTAELRRQPTKDRKNRQRLQRSASFEGWLPASPLWGNQRAGDDAHRLAPAILRARDSLTYAHPGPRRTGPHGRWCTERGRGQPRSTSCDVSRTLPDCGRVVDGIAGVESGRRDPDALAIARLPGRVRTCACFHALRPEPSSGVVR